MTADVDLILYKLHDHCGDNFQSIYSVGSAWCFCCASVVMLHEISTLVSCSCGGSSDEQRTCVCPRCSCDTLVASDVFEMHATRAGTTPARLAEMMRARWLCDSGKEAGCRDRR